MQCYVTDCVQLMCECPIEIDRVFLVDGSIDERRIEEFQENMSSVFREIGDDPEFRQVAAHAYISLAGIWKLTRADAAKLLNVSNESIDAWCAKDASGLSTGHLEKISCLLGIYRYLYILNSANIGRVSAWMHRSNAGALFAGDTPYKFLAGSDVAAFYSVRRELAARTV